MNDWDGEGLIGAEYLATEGDHRGQILRVAKWTFPEDGRDHYIVETEFGRTLKATGMMIRKVLVEQEMIRDEWWRGFRAGLLYAQPEPPMPHLGPDAPWELREVFRSGVACARKCWGEDHSTPVEATKSDPALLPVAMRNNELSEDDVLKLFAEAQRLSAAATGESY